MKNSCAECPCDITSEYNMQCAIQQYSAFKSCPCSICLVKSMCIIPCEAFKELVDKIIDEYRKDHSYII